MSAGRRREAPSTRLAAGTLALIALGALAAPWLAPHDPAVPHDLLRLRNAPPGAGHWLGTDPLARDLLSRALFGARSSLLVGTLATAVATLLGTLCGALAAALAPRAADAVMAGVDAVRAVPRALLLLALLALVPRPSLLTLALALGATSWTALGRLVFAQVRQLRAREFVAAARALGASPARLLARHVAPHLAAPVGAAAALLLADLLALEATLSFLGLGVRPPRPSWGAMVQDGLPYLSSAWWVAALPCALLVTTVLCVARLADRLAAPPPAR